MSRKPAQIVLILTALIIIITIVAVLYATYMADNQPRRGLAMEGITELFRKETKQLGTVILKNYHEFRGNTVRWSAAYFGCLFGSATLSALAALFLKLEVLRDSPKLRTDIAAFLATIAALLVTLSTTGDFQRKWQANRVAAGEMENLAYELIRPSAVTNLDAIVTRIQEITERRNRAIVGEPAELVSKDSPLPSGATQLDAQGDTPEASSP